MMGDRPNSVKISCLASFFFGGKCGDDLSLTVTLTESLVLSTDLIPFGGKQGVAVTTSIVFGGKSPFSISSCRIAFEVF